MYKSLIFYNLPKPSLELKHPAVDLVGLHQGVLHTLKHTIHVSWTTINRLIDIVVDINW